MSLPFLDQARGTPHVPAGAPAGKSSPTCLGETEGCDGGRTKRGAWGGVAGDGGRVRRRWREARWAVGRRRPVVGAPVDRTGGPVRPSSSTSCGGSRAGSPAGWVQGAGLRPAPSIRRPSTGAARRRCGVRGGDVAPVVGRVAWVPSSTCGWVEPRSGGARAVHRWARGSIASEARKVPHP